MDGCIYRTKDGECDLYAEGGKYHAFCVGDAPCDGRKQSNADKYFRNATDEELVNMILKFDVCGQIPLKKCYSHNGNCESCILDWLKQEVENDD